MQLPNREELDEWALALLVQMNDRHRDELRRWLGNPPLWENVPQVFWRKVEREVNDELAAVLLLIYAQSAEFHGLDPDTATVAGRRWAANQAGATARQYTETTQARTQAATQEWLQRMLVDGEQIPQADIDERLDSILGESRATGAAMDAVTTAQTGGGEDAVRALGGITDTDTWYTEQDDKVCPTCEPLHAQPRTVWQSEVPAGPPAHPRCRCWIVYDLPLQLGN